MREHDVCAGVGERERGRVIRRLQCGRVHEDVHSLERERRGVADVAPAALRRPVPEHIRACPGRWDRHERSGGHRRCRSGVRRGDADGAADSERHVRRVGRWSVVCAGERVGHAGGRRRAARVRSDARRVQCGVRAVGVRAAAAVADAGGADGGRVRDADILRRHHGAALSVGRAGGSDEPFARAESGEPADDAAEPAVLLRRGRSGGVAGVPGAERVGDGVHRRARSGERVVVCQLVELPRADRR